MKTPEEFAAIAKAAGVDALARDLEGLVDISHEDALRVVAEEIEIAGWPEGGAGMAAEYEWSERQMALLIAADEDGRLHWKASYEPERQSAEERSAAIIRWNRENPL